MTERIELPPEEPDMDNFLAKLNAGEMRCVLFTRFVSYDEACRLYPDRHLTAYKHPLFGDEAALPITDGEEYACAALQPQAETVAQRAERLRRLANKGRKRAW